MHSLAAKVAVDSEIDLGDRTPCPSCGTLLDAPKSSDYLGLGRIAHAWHCGQCGERFRTTARMAGLLDPEPAASEHADGRVA